MYRTNTGYLYVIGFDGMNRCGKGTQLNNLRNFLLEHSIPNLIVRGDGSREGLGIEEGDPENVWWQGFHSSLKEKRSDKERFDLWNIGSSRLVDEFLWWKYYYLPRKMEDSESELGFLLLDRSILSRLVLVLDSGEFSSFDDLYSGASVDWEEMIPDILFHLQVPKDELLNRLKKEDEKYEFRLKMISQKYSVYLRALPLLPSVVKSRMITLDGSKSPEEISWAVRGKICNLLEMNSLHVIS